MLNKKLLASILLIIAVMFAQVGNAAAAPQTQDTTYPQITEITTETDDNGVTTVLVTRLFEDQSKETVRISLEHAVFLGLVDSETQQPVPLAELPEDVTIEEGEVIEVVPVEEPVEPDVHLISELLAKFFFEGEEENEMALLIDGFHTGDNEADHVFGFGVIAQALWIARNSDGDANIEVAEDILVAKQTKNFEEFFTDHEEYQDLLEDGAAAPTNWGQFKKLLSEKKDNLGTVVSEQAEDSLEDDGTAPQNQGQGQDKQDKKEKKEKKDKKEKKP